MNALNSIIIEGNVVRDPVVRETPRGFAVCTFSIASNRFYKQDDEFEQETSFFEVESWSKLAEACGKNCTKGRGVRVIGRLKQDRWTSPDGKNFCKVKLVAEHVEFKPHFKETVASSAESMNDSDVAPDTVESDDFQDSARKDEMAAAGVSPRAIGRKAASVPAF